MSNDSQLVADKPTLADIDFVLEQAQYGYESHMDWEQYFRCHQCCGAACPVCKEASLLGDADFHEQQKKRYEIELRVLRWVKNEIRQ